MSRMPPGQNQPQAAQANQQPPRQRNSVITWRRVYAVCRWILKGTQWFSTAVILVIFVTLAATLLAGQSKDLGNTLVIVLLSNIEKQRLLALIILGTLLLLIIVAWLLTLFTPQKDRDPSKEEEARKREEAILKAENDLLTTERSALIVEERKATSLDQLLVIQREQIALLKQSQMTTSNVQLLPQALDERVRQSYLRSVLQYTTTGSLRTILSSTTIPQTSLCVSLLHDVPSLHPLTLTRVLPGPMPLQSTQQAQRFTCEDIFVLMPQQPVGVLLGKAGTGKSTFVCWLAAQGAQAALPHSSTSGSVRVPGKLPLLIYLRDYASLYMQAPLSLKRFITEHMPLIDSAISAYLLSEMMRGHCLVLFDGLDEIADNDLRRQIAQIVQTFIVSNSGENTTSDNTNYFFITSRNSGYPADIFAMYPHYTLLDLEEQQSEVVLATWCTALKRAQMLSTRGIKGTQSLSIKEEKEVEDAGDAQARYYLWPLLKGIPQLVDLASNPLFLTFMMQFQWHGRDLTQIQQRFALCQIVIQTLFETRKHASGSLFSPEEILWCERALSNLAYRSLRVGKVSEEDLQLIVHRTIAEVSLRCAYEVKASEVSLCIDTLIQGCDLLIPCQNNGFCLPSPILHNYLVAQFLLERSWARQIAITLQMIHLPRWQEPLLLALSQPRQHRSSRQRQHFTMEQEILRVIVEYGDGKDAGTQNILLSIMRKIAADVPWVISKTLKTLQEEVAHRIFLLYYHLTELSQATSLCQEIQEVMFQSLCETPSATEQAVSSSVLELLRAALFKEHVFSATSQEGAIRLLADLAPRLTSCNTMISSLLRPPLVYLAEMVLPPSEINTLPVKSVSQQVKETAIRALRALGWQSQDLDTH